MARFISHVFVVISTILVFGAPVSAQSSKDVYQIAVTQSGKSLGVIELELWPEVAPLHAAFFAARVAEGFYNGTAFHRVIPNFMIQGGDPNSIDQPKNTWGTGGYSESVPAEFFGKHVRGVLSAARTSDPNSFSGQFFICAVSLPSLDGQYSAFGKVLSGLNVVDLIINTPRDGRDNPVNKVSMTITQKVTSVQEDVNNGGVTVHPLPAHDVLHVAAEFPSAITLVNTNGETVKQLRVEAGSTSINVSDLPCGAYVLVSESSAGVTYRPILVAAQ